ncbi:MAG TPA: SDR family oxidoreductase [Acidimicrobiales bacterium]|nr:SDR family oxidoreductase [Acidimicrobiales bacterium]
MSENTRVTVVTGGGGGMGLAVAAELAHTGVVLLADVSEDLLEEATGSLADTGADVRTQRCDVTDPDDVDALARKVAELGGLGSLVHMAGISPKMADGRRVLEVDLVGTLRVLEALLPHASEGTAAVCIGSVAGYADLASEVDPLLDDALAPGFVAAVEAKLGEGFDAMTAYVLAKRGVMRACERLSGPWGARGARILSIAPGIIDTPMGRLELDGDDLVAAMIDATPVKRPGHSPFPGRPADIAALVAFLCSDAAAFISGCDIRIDGGLVGSMARQMGIPG